MSLSEKEDVKGPLPMAAALAPKTAPEEGKPRPAIVVIGNSTFVSNAFFNFPGNSDFFLHTTGLAGRGTGFDFHRPQRTGIASIHAQPNTGTGADIHPGRAPATHDAAHRHHRVEETPTALSV
ncbi:MAG: hypothetical protein QM706_19025 [Nitrospira sp.]